MTLFFNSLLFLIFSEYFYINANVLIIVYLIYTVIYLFNVNHTYYILPNNFNFLSTFTEFKTILNLFSRGLTLFLNLFVKFNLV